MGYRSGCGGCPSGNFVRASGSASPQLPETVACHISHTNAPESCQRQRLATRQAIAKNRCPGDRCLGRFRPSALANKAIPRYVQLRIIKRRERGNQRGFETHCACKQIAREHAPGALLASYVARARNLVDDDSQLTLAFHDALYDRLGHSDRWRHAKAAALAIGHKSPTAQKRVPLAIN